MHLRCIFLVKIVAIYTLLVCKIFGPKIRSCKFFDKSQVWSKVIFIISNKYYSKTNNKLDPVGILEIISRD